MKRILLFLIMFGIGPIASASVTLHSESAKQSPTLIDSTAGSASSKLLATAALELHANSSRTIIDLEPRSTTLSFQGFESNLYEEVMLEIEAVPEPSSSSLLLGSAVVILMRRKR